MQRYLFEYKVFVSFVLTDLSFYTALAMRKNPYSEGIFNTAAPGAMFPFRNDVTEKQVVMDVR